MSAPGDIVILAVLLAAFLACVGYAAGRIHQRRQYGPERDQAYQEGYDSATRSVFSMAARVAGRRRGSMHVSEVVPEKGSSGRHLVPDELVQAATYRLPPDRVARAKVPQSEKS